jgi:hypothetical protein
LTPPNSVNIQAIGKAANEPLVPGAGLKKPQPNHVESNMAILLLVVILL